MLIQEIEANALDLAGGELIRQKLDSHFATLVTLNIIETMMLELSNANKSLRSNSVTFSLTSGINTGTVVTTTQQLDVRFVRYRTSSVSSWRILDIVHSIDALTRAENDGKEAILFDGTVSPVGYTLSWKPDATLEAELWGSKAISEETNLNVAAAIPPEFGTVAAYRIADFLLNQLLLLDEAKYTSFVVAQKASLAGETSRVGNVWRSHLSHPSNMHAQMRSNSFSAWEDDDYDNTSPSDLVFGGGSSDSSGGGGTFVSDATALLKGIVKLSIAPDGDPIAIGTNEPFAGAAREIKYANGFASLTAAVTSIGSTPTELRVSSPTPMPADITTPSTLLLSFEGSGQILIAAGKTLTVGRMRDPGNRQVFVQADATANLRFSQGAVEKMNVAWLASSDDITNAIDQHVGTCAANNAGHIYIPAGVWTTTGDHQTTNGFILSGDGMANSGGTELQFTGSNAGIFNIGENKYNISFRNLTIDGAERSGSVGVLFEGTAGTTTNIRFQSVKIRRCVQGVQIAAGGSGAWQVAALSFDEFCMFEGNTSNGITCNSSNNAILCAANFFVPGGARAGTFDRGGQVTFIGNEFAGAGLFGDNQIETQTVVAAAGIITSGDAKSVITWPGMLGSPHTVTVPLTDAEHTTAALIAAAFRTALANDPNVGSFFHVGGTGAVINLIALDAAANVASANFTIENVTSVGITNDTSSVNTLAGAVDTDMSDCVVKISGPHGGTFNFIGTQDEQFRTFLQNDASDFNNVINIDKCLIQAPIRLNQTCKVNVTGSIILAKTLRDGAASSSVVNVDGCFTKTWHYTTAGAQYTVEGRPDNFYGGIGGSTIARHADGDLRRFTDTMPTTSFETDNNFFQTAADAWFKLLSTRERDLLELGACTVNGIPTHTYKFRRSSSDGRLKINGSQAGQIGVDFNCPIKAEGLIEAPRIVTNHIEVVTPGATPAMNAGLSNVFSLTPGENETITISNHLAGQPITLIILTSGVSTYTLTFGGDFKPNGTLATGATTGKYFVLEFISNGTHVIEKSRTTAL